MIIRRLEALFGFRVDKAQFDQATSAIDRFATNANSALGVIAGHFAFQAIKDFVDHTTEAMANVGRTSKFLGISANALEELRYAAQKSGVTLDTLDDSLKELQIRAVDAKAGTGEAAEAFQYLGMSSTDASGRMREPLELLDEVADRLQTLPTQSERIWVLDSMLGDQGAEMLKILKDGSAGLATMRQEAKALGHTLDDDAIEQAMVFRETINRLKAAIEGLVRPLIRALLPGITAFSHFASSLSSGLLNLIQNTTILRTVCTALSVVLGIIAIKSAIAFAPFFGLALLIAGIALVIDDLWTAFSGGDSVFLSLHKNAREFFEPIEQWVVNLPKTMWQGLVEGADKALASVSAKLTAFKDRTLSMVSNIGEKLAGMFDGLVPDFLKKGLFATVNMASDKPEQTRNQQQWAPQVLPSPNSIQNHSNQSVTVAVNVKTGVNAHEIGGEVSKAVRKELERERINAFMGVSRYANS